MGYTDRHGLARTMAVVCVVVLAVFPGWGEVLYKNTASQKVAFYAYDTSAEGAKSGDASNITAEVSLDGGALYSLNDTNPSELGSSGVYVFDLLTSETNGNLVVIVPASSTGNVVIEPASWHTIVAERGTDSAALASVATEARLAELDAANLPADVDAVKTTVTAVLADTGELQTDWANGGRLDLLIDGITAYVDDLEGRLTAQRGSNLDELGAVNLPADIDTLIARLTAARAGYLDKLNIAGTIAQTGADGDTLETLSDQIDGVGGGGGDATAANQATMIAALADVKGTGFTSPTHSLKAVVDRGNSAWVTGGAGSGSITFTYSLTSDVGGTSITDCLVSVYTGSNKTGFMGSAYTDNFGECVFELDAGTYYLWRKKAGYTFSNPDTEVVN